MSSLFEKNFGDNCEDKVALITGSTKGFGENIAYYLSSLGFKLVITGRDERRINSVVQKCREIKNQRVIGIKADLLIDSNVDKLVEKTIEEFGKIDLLINSSNITIPCLITDSNFMDIYSKVFNTNVRSFILLVSKLVPYLEKTEGSIITVMSDMGAQPYEKELPFCVSEAATDMLTRTLALELRSKKIKVLSINSSILISPAFVSNPWLSITMHSRL